MTRDTGETQRCEHEHEKERETREKLWLLLDETWRFISWYEAEMLQHRETFWKVSGGYTTQWGQTGQKGSEHDV